LEKKRKLNGIDMLKRNTLKACLLISAIIFGLSLNGFTENPCSGPDCPSSLSTIQGNVQYSADWILAWDWENSAKTMTQDASVNVYVLGGFGPYTWSVSGMDFSLDQTKTQERSNRLNAGISSCGSATITVTDARGSVTEGSVRNTSAGYWKTYAGQCGLAAPDDNGEWRRTEPHSNVGYLQGDVTLGGKKQRHKHKYLYLGDTYSKSKAECESKRCQNSASLISPCMPFPDYFEAIRYPWVGEFYYCGNNTRDYAEQCHWGGHYWQYRTARLQYDEYTLTYWQWECQ
jgi:hypothetical protein